MKKVLFLLALSIITFSCTPSWTAEEKNIINSELRVYKTSSPSDSAVLRAQCIDIPERQLKKAEYELLIKKMLKTVQDPVNNGVGIAAPQIGINRNLVLVQRFDKEGEPFEAYPNLRVIHFSDSLQTGPEGCLSIDNAYGNVTRAASIQVSYFDSALDKTVEENISGFTAVIFQHEADHLNGILFTDYLK